MINRFTIFLSISFTLGSISCASIPPIKEENLPVAERTYKLKPFQLKAAIDYYIPLRTNVFRNFQQSGQTVAAYEYAYPGVDLGNGLFLDINGNLSLNASTLFDLDKKENVSIECDGNYGYTLSKGPDKLYFKEHGLKFISPFPSTDELVIEKDGFKYPNVFLFGDIKYSLLANSIVKISKDDKKELLNVKGTIANIATVPEVTVKRLDKEDGLLISGIKDFVSLKVISDKSKNEILLAAEIAQLFSDKTFVVKYKYIRSANKLLLFGEDGQGLKIEKNGNTVSIYSFGISVRFQDYTCTVQ